MSIVNTGFAIAQLEAIAKAIRKYGYIVYADELLEVAAFLVKAAFLAKHEFRTPEPSAEAVLAAARVISQSAYINDPEQDSVALMPLAENVLKAAAAEEALYAAVPVTKLAQVDYDNLVRDAMLWRARKHRHQCPQCGCRFAEAILSEKGGE